MDEKERLMLLGQTFFFLRRLIKRYIIKNIDCCINSGVVWTKVYMTINIKISGPALCTVTEKEGYFAGERITY